MPRSFKNTSTINKILFGNNTGQISDTAILFVMIFFLIFAFCFLTVLYVFGKMVMEKGRKSRRRAERILNLKTPRKGFGDIEDSFSDNWSSIEQNTFKEASFTLSPPKSRDLRIFRKYSKDEISIQKFKETSKKFPEFEDSDQTHSKDDSRKCLTAVTPKRTTEPSFHSNPALLNKGQSTMVDKIAMRLSKKIKEFHGDLNRSVSDMSLLPSFENGRFQNSFTDICEIGKGSYGAVFKSRHKLENKTYAIKKINFEVAKGKNPRMELLFREVEAMLNLEQRNIVKYITSWIENDDTQSPVDQTPRSSLNDESSQFPAMNFSKKTTQDYFLESNGQQNCVGILKEEFGSLMPRDVEFVHNYLGDNSRKFQPYMDLQICFEEQTPSANDQDESSPETENSEIHLSKSEIRKQGVDKLSLFIQMEYCKGLSLSSYIRQPDFCFSDPEIFGIFTQVVEGLAFIHNKNMAHRDLKPGNILFDESGTLKICDFGLAVKKYNLGSKKPRLDVNEDLDEMVFAGTPLYSPLDNSGDSLVDFDNKMDIYALGVILFELLSDFRTDHQRINAIRQLKQNSKTGAAFKQTFACRAGIVDRLIDFDRTKRPDAQNIKNLPEFIAWENEVVEVLSEEV